jgi:hypothetical protein
MSSWDNETPPKDTRLLPKGMRGFKIVSGEEGVSKAGNSQFIVGLKDEETGIVATVYLLRKPGKRWYLKSLLEAVGVEKQEDDAYNYLPEIMDKKLTADVIHEPNEYINRDGETITTTQHKLNSFYAYTTNPDGVTTASGIAWEN